MESGILGIGFRNIQLPEEFGIPLTIGIHNPSPTDKESGIQFLDWNPWNGIQNPRLSWGAFLWDNPDKDQWSEIMVHQMDRWPHSGQRFIGSFPWSEWFRITDPDLDHPKGTHLWIPLRRAKNRPILRTFSQLWWIADNVNSCTKGKRELHLILSW